MSKASQKDWPTIRVLIAGKKRGPEARAWVKVRRHYFAVEKLALKPVLATTADEAIDLLQRESFDLVFLDKVIQSSEAERIAEACAKQNDPPVLVLDFPHDVLMSPLEKLGLDVEVGKTRLVQSVQRRLDRLAAREQASS